MNLKNTDIITRKEFIEKFGRAALLGVLVFIPTYLISNKKVAKEAAHCEIDIQCSGCNKRNGCKLIKKSEYKEEK